MRSILKTLPLLPTRVSWIFNWLIFHFHRWIMNVSVLKILLEIRLMYAVIICYIRNSTRATKDNYILLLKLWLSPVSGRALSMVRASKGCETRYPTCYFLKDLSFKYRCKNCKTSERMLQTLRKHSQSSHRRRINIFRKIHMQWMIPILSLPCASFAQQINPWSLFLKQGRRVKQCLEKKNTYKDKDVVKIWRHCFNSLLVKFSDTSRRTRTSRSVDQIFRLYCCFVIFGRTALFTVSENNFSVRSTSFALYNFVRRWKEVEISPLLFERASENKRGEWKIS